MISPRFAAWLSAQPEETQAAITAKWEALKTDPAIEHGHPRADYARRTMLLRFARDEFGYA